MKGHCEGARATGCHSERPQVKGIADHRSLFAASARRLAREEEGLREAAKEAVSGSKQSHSHVRLGYSE